MLILLVRNFHFECTMYIVHVYAFFAGLTIIRSDEMPTYRVFLGCHRPR